MKIFFLVIGLTISIGFGAAVGDYVFGLHTVGLWLTIPVLLATLLAAPSTLDALNAIKNTFRGFVSFFCFQFGTILSGIAGAAGVIIVLIEGETGITLETSESMMRIGLIGIFTSYLLVILLTFRSRIPKGMIGILRNTVLFEGRTYSNLPWDERVSFVPTKYEEEIGLVLNFSDVQAEIRVETEVELVTAINEPALKDNFDLGFILGKSREAIQSGFAKIIGNRTITVGQFFKEIGLSKPGYDTKTEFPTICRVKGLALIKVF